jgi:NAD+ dependent glucose-6-phosphate dehydrogenase
MAKKRILITGVYGLVGSSIYKLLLSKPDLYDVYGMARRRKRSDRVAEEEAVDIPEDKFFASDLSDMTVLEDAFEGIDTVIHMAADPNTEAPWESVLKNNIEGGYHMFEAARKAGVKRVIYASTIQVSTGWALNVEPYKSIRALEFDKVPDSFDRLKTSEVAWPVNLYASSKVFGETLARMYSSTHDMSCICLRIGAVNSMDEKMDHLIPLSCTKNDIARLTECCIQAPDTLKFDIYYGMSNNQYLWPDIKNAEENVGYVPEDSFRYDD